MSDIEPSKDYQIRLLCCALHDPALLAKLMQTTKPADWTWPASRFVWLCMLDLITASGAHPTFERLAGYVELRCMNARPAGGDLPALQPSEFESLAQVLERMAQTTAAAARADSANLEASLPLHLARVRNTEAADALQQVAQAATQGGDGTPTTADVSDVVTGLPSPIMGRIACGVYATKGGLFLACVECKNIESSTTTIAEGSQRKISVGWTEVGMWEKRRLSAGGVVRAVKRYIRDFTPTRVAVTFCGGSINDRNRYRRDEIWDLVNTIFEAAGANTVYCSGTELERACRSIFNKNRAPHQFLMAILAAEAVVLKRDDVWARMIVELGKPSSWTPPGNNSSPKFQPRRRALWID